MANGKTLGLLCPLITRHILIYLRRPCVDAALKVVECFEAGVGQIHGGVQAADAVVAIHDNRQAVGQFVAAQRNQVHRDVDGVGQGADGGFFVGTHVKQQKGFAVLPPALQFGRGELGDVHVFGFRVSL